MRCPIRILHLGGRLFADDTPALPIFFGMRLPKPPTTPLPLSVYNPPSAPAADIEIDIKTVEKLIGEIIVQPLR